MSLLEELFSFVLCNISFHFIQNKFFCLLFIVFGVTATISQAGEAQAGRQAGCLAKALSCGLVIRVVKSVQPAITTNSNNIILTATI